MARTLSGTCYCGAVQYAVADEFIYAMNCHCSGCRRTTGAAFKSFAGIERGKFIVTQGRDRLLIYGSDVEKAHNAHCGTCGSFLYSLVRDGQYVHVALGSLADEPAIRPTHHIFVGSKAPWFTITDDLPQYEGHVTRSGSNARHRSAGRDRHPPGNDWKEADRLFAYRGYMERLRAGAELGFRRRATSKRAACSICQEIRPQNPLLRP